VPGKQLYEFGPYRVDVALSRLERDGRSIPLPPKAFDLLLLLAQNPDRIVRKTEIIETLWPDTFVDDANLTQHIYTLRKALGDQPDGRPYIETLARRGYRLAATVRSVEPTTAESRPAARPLVHEGERKQATVMHCAVADAVGLVERLGANGMRSVMRELLAISVDAIEPHHGIITERRTDGFVAIFGARAVHEDDVQRSVLAALAIRRRFRALADDEARELRIAIHNGPVVISRLAGDRDIEYTAIGETLRAADRLLQAASPGAIVLSEAARRVVRSDVFVDSTAAAVPGGGRAYTVAGLLRETRAEPRVARASSPLIGRDDELALFDALVAQAMEGKGHALSVVGEPGMGKSRLAAEFTRRLAHAATPPLILEGRCVSYGSFLPYLPVADLVRACCGVEESDPPERIRRAVEDLATEYGLDADAIAWLLRLVGVDDGSASIDALSPEAAKGRTFQVVRSLLLRIAGRRPLVIVVEDMHWTDRTSEEFLTTFVERLGGAPIMLVATYRPVYRAPWMDRSYVTLVPLSPLGPAESARLVQSVMRRHALEPDVSQAILQRGEGNPFFLEELARTVEESGPGTHVIPETVHGVIMARIDRLQDSAKQLLQTASVLGREVSLELLRRAWTGATPFDAEIDELCRLEFLIERPGGDESTYMFKHALTQDVAYDSLLARHRRAIHLRAGQALMEMYGDRAHEIAATLAYHYARTDAIENAVIWLTRAAERAARVYANAEAILHLDIAAQRLQRMPEGGDRDRWMLRVALLHAHSLYFLGRFRESVEVLLPHAARLARLNDAALGAAYSFWLAHMYSRLGDQRRATEHADRAIHISTAIGDTATLGKAHGLLALECYWSGRPAVGVSQGREAVRLLDGRSSERWWLGMAHFYLALNHHLAGDFDDALSESQHADAVGKEIGDPRLQTYAAYIVGWTEACRGRHDLAIAACRRGLEQAPDRVSRAYASLFLACALVERGDHRDALALLEPVVAEFEEFAIPQWHAFAATLAGESLRGLGRIDEAEQAVQRGLQIATRAGYTIAAGFGNVVEGRLALEREKPDDARAAFRRALETFERSGAAFEATRTRAELGRLERANG